MVDDFLFVIFFTSLVDNASFKVVWICLFKVTVDLQSAFWKMLCLRAALKKTMVNYRYILLES